MSTKSKHWLIVASLFVSYFIIFPDDLSAILASAREILSLSNAISPGVYAVLVSGVIAWTLARCFGRPRNLTAR